MDIFNIFMVLCTPFLLLFLHISTHHLLLHMLRNLPPSPLLAFPVIGHLYLFKKPLHRALSKVTERYGPVVFLRLGLRPAPLISSPSAAEECFTKNDTAFANRPRFLTGKHLDYNYTNLFFSPYDEHWRNLRRISAVELFSPHRLQSLSRVRVQEVVFTIQSLFRRVSNDNKEYCYTPVELKPVLFEVTFNVVLRMIAGKRFHCGTTSGVESVEVKRLEEMVTETFRLGAKSSLGDFLPFMWWFGIDRGLEEEFMALQM